MPFRAAFLAASFALAVASCAGAAANTPPPTAAQQLNAEGVRRLERGELDGAEGTFREALRESELVDDLLGQAEAWNNLGAIATARALPREAWACHAAALRLHQARHARDAGEVRTRTNLGGAMLASGDTEHARAEFEAARDLARSLGAPEAALLADVGLASVSFSKGDFAAARDAARSAATRAHDTGDDGAEAAALSVCGAAEQSLGDTSGAAKSFGRALDIDRKREQPVAVGADLLALAQLAERAKRNADAASLYGRASRVARRLGQLDLAERELERATSLAESAGSPETEPLRAELQALREARKR